MTYDWWFVSPGDLAAVEKAASSQVKVVYDGSKGKGNLDKAGFCFSLIF